MQKCGWYTFDVEPIIIYIILLNYNINCGASQTSNCIESFHVNTQISKTFLINSNVSKKKKTNKTWRHCIIFVIHQVLPLLNRLHYTTRGCYIFDIQPNIIYIVLVRVFSANNTDIKIKIIFNHFILVT